MTKRILKYCFVILFFALISLNGKAQEEYMYENQNTSFELDSVKRLSDFEYIYYSMADVEIFYSSDRTSKKRLCAIKFLCDYKGHIYDCEIDLDVKFKVKNIKLYARKVYKEDTSVSSHNVLYFPYSYYGIGSSTTTHHKKGDYAGSNKIYSYRKRYNSNERVYYKDFLKQF
jgi:hypothetical protein